MWLGAGALGGVAQAVAQRAQLADRAVQCGSLGRQHLPVDVRPPVRRKHRRDLNERESGGAAKRDQRQPLQHVGIEQPAQAPPANGSDHPLLLIES